MNAETARLLAAALRTRNEAEAGLLALLALGGKYLEVPPEPVRQSMAILAATYVHEQRIVNRIVYEAGDE